MNIEVITYNEIGGAHRWPNADGEHSYLNHFHRHIFVIECRFAVSHANREIEIFDMQETINQYFIENHAQFHTIFDFDTKSCETIADEIINAFSEKNIISCTVREDGRGGACAWR